VIAPEAKTTYYQNRRLRRGLSDRYSAFLRDCDVVLDVGCGTGDFGAVFPGTVHGVDNDPAAVAAARRNEIAVVADLTEPLPYPDALFDGILARDILEHLMEPWLLVREMRRVLKPAGVVVASLVQDRPRRVWADYTHVRGFSESTARGLFLDNGFDIKSSWPMGGVPLSDRLGLIPHLPWLLRIPPLGTVWASSWELVAVRN
jgi:SAM-dependent methyltransferase